LKYNVTYKKSVHHDLLRLPKAEAVRIIGHIEEELVKNPTSHPVLKGRFAGLRKLRIGDYRVIFTIVSNEVHILRIGHRGNVYINEI
jgi:addiction module RelE/StbE family toxin